MPFEPTRRSGSCRTFQCRYNDCLCLCGNGVLGHGSGFLSPSLRHFGFQKNEESVKERNLCVNRQLEMNVLLLGPIVAAIILGLPLIIPILYNAQFIGMLQMTQLAAVAMLFKAVYLPIEYLPLSKGDSRLFLIQESFCVILLIVCEIAGYQLDGLRGVGGVLPLLMP